MAAEVEGTVAERAEVAAANSARPPTLTRSSRGPGEMVGGKEKVGNSKRCRYLDKERIAPSIERQGRGIFLKDHVVSTPLTPEPHVKL